MSNETETAAKTRRYAEEALRERLAHSARVARLLAAYDKIMEARINARREEKSK
jgi:hypothetical protein